MVAALFVSHTVVANDMDDAKWPSLVIGRSNISSHVDPSIDRSIAEMTPPINVLGSIAGHACHLCDRPGKVPVWPGFVE